MKHPKVESMLSELVDATLSSSDEKFVRKHLETCAHCRALHRSFQELHAFTENGPSILVRPGFAQRVMAEYNFRRGEKIWQLFDAIPRPLVTVGLALSIVLVSLFALPLLSPPRDNFESEYTFLFDGNAEANHVTDDQALAIALNADVDIAIGE